MSEFLRPNKMAFIMCHCKEICFCKNSGNGIVCMGSAGSLGTVWYHCAQNMAKWESFGLAE